MTAACAWHNGDEALEGGPGVDALHCCPECLCTIATRECERCRQLFLDWGYGPGDDIMAGPGVSIDGDFMCVNCAARIDAMLDLVDELGA